VSPAWRHGIQPLLFMGLFSCWLLFAAIGWVWLEAGERHAAQQALDEQAEQQLGQLRTQLDAMQQEARQLLRSLMLARDEGREQFSPYLASLRRHTPQLGTVALLVANPAQGRLLEVQAFEPFQLGGALLPTQDLARLPQVAAALPGLQRGQAQVLVWQRRSPEQLLLIIPGQQGMALALWLPPQALLQDNRRDGVQAVLSVQPAAPPAASEAGSLLSQQALRSGAFELNLTLWRAWQPVAQLSWRSIALLAFMLLLWLLGWRSWRQSRGLLRQRLQARRLQAQWLEQARQQAPVSPQRALATLERQLQTLPPAGLMRVWWVHGRGVRRRSFHQASAMLQLESQLAKAPFDGLTAVRLRHGQVLLVLLQDEAGMVANSQRLSHWLTAVMGGRPDEASMLWHCFEMDHGVAELERALLGTSITPLYSAASPLPPGR